SQRRGGAPHPGEALRVRDPGDPAHARVQLLPGLPAPDRRGVQLMPRWYVLRALLYKEALRYRYNWGLLVLVFSLLALSALPSLSAKTRLLPEASGAVIDRCSILYPAGSKEAKAW